MDDSMRKLVSCGAHGSNSNDCIQSERRDIFKIDWPVRLRGSEARLYNPLRASVLGESVIPHSYSRQIKRSLVPPFRVRQKIFPPRTITISILHNVLQSNLHHLSQSSHNWSYDIEPAI